MTAQEHPSPHPRAGLVTWGLVLALVTLPVVWLDVYLLATDDASGVHLACPPEIEATIFEISASPGGAADAWDHLPDLSCPTTIAAGESTFLPDIFAAQAERSHAELITVPGGHFVLHENTTRGADLIARKALR